MEIEIKNKEDLNAAATKLRAHSVQMCNDTDIESVNNNFIAAKDLLIAIYKYSVKRLNKTEDKQ